MTSHGTPKRPSKTADFPLQAKVLDRELKHGLSIMIASVGIRSASGPPIVPVVPRQHIYVRGHKEF
jgi:hypothetical protein